MWIYKHELITLLGASDHANPSRYVRQWCKRNGVPIYEATRGTWRVLREDFDNAFRPRQNHPTPANAEALEAFAAWKDAG